MKCVALDKRNASLESNGRRNHGSFASLETFNRVAWKFLTQGIKRLSLNCTEIISALSCVPCSRFPHNEQTTIVGTCRIQTLRVSNDFCPGETDGKSHFPAAYKDDKWCLWNHALWHISIGLMFSTARFLRFPRSFSFSLDTMPSIKYHQRTHSRFV